MKKAFNFLFINTKAGFFLLAALLWSGVMSFVNNHHGITWKEIFVEADGMVFDLIVFGVILTIYEAFRERKEKNERAEREKNEKIERLHEEIDDYRGWDEKEAMYRIVGAIRRLNKLGVSRIMLHHCYLKGALLHYADLRNAELSGANLQGAVLARAKLDGAIFRNANLENATFLESSLEWTQLMEANLMRASFQGANLRGVWVEPNWFELLEKWQVRGREEIYEKYEDPKRDGGGISILQERKSQNVDSHAEPK